MRGLEHQWRVWRCAAVGLNSAQQIPRLLQHIRLEFEQIPTRVFYASVGSVSLRLSLLQRLGIGLRGELATRHSSRQELECAVSSTWSMFWGRHRQSRAQVLEILKRAGSRLNPMHTDHH